MPRLKTNARKKLRQALRRVNEVVWRDVKNSIQQQRKWKAKVVEGRRK